MGLGRRVTIGLVMALIVALATAAASAAKVPHLPPGFPALLAGVVFAASLFLDPIKTQVADWLAGPSRRQAVMRAQLRMRDRNGRIQRVYRCTDAIALGVHPAESPTTPGTPMLPHYVRRDAHSALRKAFAEGGLVVIMGRSATGKTRLAYEVMRDFAPRRWLIVPAASEALRELARADLRVRNTVVWLDDLERYLATGDLNAAVLDSLSAPGTSSVVLATLRGEALTAFTNPGTDLSGSQEVLRRAVTIHLEGDLTELERHRAEQYMSDPRVAAALRQTGVGFAEYLAAGPAALSRWESARSGANGTAASIIAAAIDIRRAGHMSPIPRHLLETLHCHYLDARELHRPDRSGFEQGLAWAVERVNGASSCLIPVGNDCYDPFSYLLDYAQEGPSQPISSAIWDTLLPRIPTADLTSFAAAALYAGKLTISEQAFRRAAIAGSAIGMHGLGFVLARTGRSEEAEEWVRRAAQDGNTSAMSNLGVLLVKVGRAEEAEQWYRRAAEQGHGSAMNNLGALLDEKGSSEEAERWFRRAAERGETIGMANLGMLLVESPKQEEFVKWSRKADTSAEMSYLLFLMEAGRIEEAEQWLRRAAGDSPEPPAGTGEAEILLRRAADQGDINAISVLSNLMASTGRTREAAAVLRRAADQGNLRAMNQLGVLAADAGRPEEAERWWRRAADGGYLEAMYNLGQSLHLRGKHLKEAERLLRDAADQGHLKAMVHIGALLFLKGRREEAEAWYRRAAEQGDVHAMLNLGNLLLATDRSGEAEKWIGRTAQQVDIVRDSSGYIIGIGEQQGDSGHTSNDKQE